MTISSHRVSAQETQHYTSRRLRRNPRRCRGVPPSVVSTARLLAPEGCEPLAESPLALARRCSQRKTPPSQVRTLDHPIWTTVSDLRLASGIHRTGLSALRHPHPLLTGWPARLPRANAENCQRR